MKRKFRTRISCLLIASLCIGLLSATALAADPPAGTVEDPTVTENVTTDTKQDTPAPGQTTTTTTTEKEWKGTTTEDGTTTTVDGKETTNDTTVTAPDGDLLDQTGTVAGSETTTTTPGAGDPPEKPGTTDVADSKPDGSVEVTVEPGKNTNDAPKKEQRATSPPGSRMRPSRIGQKTRRRHPNRARTARSPILKRRVRIHIRKPSRSLTAP